MSCCLIQPKITPYGPHTEGGRTGSAADPEIIFGSMNEESTPSLVTMVPFSPDCMVSPRSQGRNANEI
jgi:hypothetical protein